MALNILNTHIWWLGRINMLLNNSCNQELVVYFDLTVQIKIFYSSLPYVSYWYNKIIGRLSDLCSIIFWGKTGDVLVKNENFWISYLNKKWLALHHQQNDRLLWIYIF